MLLIAAVVTHLKVYTMVLVFLFAGEVKVERKSFDTAEHCLEQPQERMDSLVKDPRFEEGIGAWCIEEQGQKS
mgnify:CR=1 FL=1